MDLAVAFGVFLACVAGCMGKGFSLAWALLVGFICFFLVGLRRGASAGSLLRMAAGGMGTAFKVLRILLLLGLLTALWRAGGTVAFFVWGGIQLITPGTFVLVAFLSCFGHIKQLSALLLFLVHLAWVGLLTLIPRFRN